MANKLPTISSKLRKKLLFAVFAAFAILTIFSVFVQYRMTKLQTEKLLRLTIKDVYEDIQRDSDDNIYDIMRFISDTILVDDDFDLKELEIVYGLTEINIINADGIVTDSNIDSMKGYDMRSKPHTAEFFEKLTENEAFIGYFGDYSGDVEMKYAGMPTMRAGYLQIGYDTVAFYHEIQKQVIGVTNNRRVLEDGVVFIIDEHNTILSKRGDLSGETFLKQIDGNSDFYNKPTDTLYSATVDGKLYYWLSNTINDYMVVAVLPFSETVETVKVSVIMTIALGILQFAVLFVGINVIVKHYVVKRIGDIADSLAEITNGDLDTEVSVRTTVEFSQISDGINETVGTLKEHIAREAARIDDELGYARNIQRSALPALSEQFNGRNDFKLFAYMDTAKEVGGDFYDFFMQDDGRPAFLIADVSGKGIPAAMFMMKGKTTLHDCTDSRRSIGDTFSLANERLCEGNDTGMFITAWMGILDTAAGTVSFANAGHNPPVLVRDGKAEFIEMENDLIFGVMDDADYMSQTLTLKENDLLFLYTDGVTEATNAVRELYGEKRLLETLGGIVPEGEDICEEVCRRVTDSIDKFVAGSPQADDITMLCLLYKKHETEM